MDRAGTENWHVVAWDLSKRYLISAAGDWEAIRNTPIVKGRVLDLNTGRLLYCPNIHSLYTLCVWQRITIPRSQMEEWLSCIQAEGKALPAALRQSEAEAEQPVATNVSSDEYVFDVRTEPVEAIARVFGISVLDARIMQWMELGLYHGDCVAVDENGNRLP